MDGIEMKDFAVEAAQRQHFHESSRIEKIESSWFWRFWKTHIRITIEEAESRDHLALERTFLAYTRTASAIAQFGVTVAQLFRLNTSIELQIPKTSLRIGRALGATIEGVAIIVMLLGAGYFAKQQIGLMRSTIIGRGYELSVMVILSFAIFAISLGLIAGSKD